MIKTYLKNIAFEIAKNSIEKATEILNLKDNNSFIYGIGYDKTIEYAVLNLKERLYYTNFKVFKGIFDGLNK